MQYCINALLKNNNEIMQYYIINNDIALIMHYRALLQMPDFNTIILIFFPQIVKFPMGPLNFSEKGCSKYLILTEYTFAIFVV